MAGADPILAGGEQVKARRLGEGAAPERDKQEQYFVASQWQLMWWKFIKHKLATIAWPVLIVLYVSAILADFLSPHLPDRRFTDYKEAPPQAIPFMMRKAGSGALVYDVKREMDEKTQPHLCADTSSSSPCAFRTRRPYKLLGLFKTDIHLIGRRGPCSSSAPTAGP